MKTILFHAPFVNRSRDTESVMVALKRKGHRVIFLNLYSDTEVSQHLKNQGIEVFFHNVRNRNKWVRYFQNVVHLIYFTWKHRVEVIYNHLEPANFVAVLAQYFIKAKVYIFRHHSDLYFLSGSGKDLSYRLIYKLAKMIIVVSASAKQHMVKVEGVNSNKIKVIRLAYDFSLYATPSMEAILKVKQKIDADLCLICVGHLTEFKRPLLSLKILYELRKRNYSAKLIYLGAGDMLKNIEEESAFLGIQNYVIKPGYVPNVLEYLAASNFLIHPSISESSCVVVKEAGLVGLPVLVTDGVGDFNEYIVDRKNGFIINQDQFVRESVKIIEEYWKRPAELKLIGTALGQDVYRFFDIKNVIDEYSEILG